MFIKDISKRYREAMRGGIEPPETRRLGGPPERRRLGGPPGGRPRPGRLRRFGRSLGGGAMRLGAAIIAPMIVEKVLDAFGLGAWAPIAEDIASVVGLTLGPALAKGASRFVFGGLKRIFTGGGITKLFTGKLGKVAEALTSAGGLLGRGAKVLVPVLRYIGFGFLGLARTIAMAGITMMANPIVLGITLAVAAVAGAAYLIWKNWDWIKKQFSDLWGWFTDIDWGGMFSSAWQGVINLPTTISNAWAGMTGYFGRLFGDIWNSAKNAPDWMQYLPFVGAPIAIIKNWDWIKEQFNEYVDWFRNFNWSGMFKDAINSVVSGVKSAWGGLKNYFHAWWDSGKKTLAKLKEYYKSAKSYLSGAEEPQEMGPPEPEKPEREANFATIAPPTSNALLADVDPEEQSKRLKGLDDSLVTNMTAAEASRMEAETIVMRGLQEQLLAYTMRQTRFLQDIRDQVAGKPVEKAMSKG
jgi:hypothetical protein